MSEIIDWALSSQGQELYFGTASVLLAITGLSLWWAEVAWHVGRRSFGTTKADPKRYHIFQRLVAYSILWPVVFGVGVIFLAWSLLNEPVIWLNRRLLKKEIQDYEQSPVGQYVRAEQALKALEEQLATIDRDDPEIALIRGVELSILDEGIAGLTDTMTRLKPEYDKQRFYERNTRAATWVPEEFKELTYVGKDGQVFVPAAHKRKPGAIFTTSSGQRCIVNDNGSFSLYSLDDYPDHDPDDEYPGYR
jgi:hypothetical protein